MDAPAHGPVAERVVRELVAASLDTFADLPVVSLGEVEGTSCEILAVVGGAHEGQSIKDLLGLGMLVLARKEGVLEPEQPVVVDSSGSMLVGTARAGRLLGHRVVGISCKNLPLASATKARLFGAEVIQVQESHPELGWQQARLDRVTRELHEHPKYYNLDQNNSPLNPRVYETWLIPSLERRLDPSTVTGGAFVVGSGGHFSALSAWLKNRSPGVVTVAVDRPGSVTFGGQPGPTELRGIGNSNGVPGVIHRHMHLVDDVIRVSDEEARTHCQKLLARGRMVGGSSGAALAAAERLARKLKRGRVLTVLPDRGELYFDTIYRTDPPDGR